jgi:hypothetical protein
MATPHCFPSLIDEATKQTVLIAGAGLSIGYVPIVDDLKDKLNKAAQDLGIAPVENFYDLAEIVLESLIDSGKSDSGSRLSLAEALGLLDDRRWFGETGLPLSGNTPRHRAIARFAVERRFRAIVSLNWDTLLEAALDSVGLADGDRIPRPWAITARTSVIHDTHLPRLANAHVFPVIKPHGCVRNLEHARRQLRSTGLIPLIIFKLTQSELDTLPQEQTLVDKKVEGYLSECPLIAVGWKASEGYLRNTVIKTAQAVQHTELDAFTLASRSWYPNSKSNETFHDEIVAAYSKTKHAAFAEVSNPEQLDCLFLWLQSRFALNKLLAASPTPHQAAMQELLQQLDQPVHGHFILRWVDSWLPTWVRLCWRAGVMRGVDPHTNQMIEPWDIPVMPRDVHVPLSGLALVRRELLAAVRLLVVLGNSLNTFNFEKFPGGFWAAETRKLYIPLPGWRGAAQTADLAALKPLIDALRGLGFVQNIYLVWLDNEALPPSQSDREQLAAQVSRLMPLANFAAVNALTWIELEALKEDSHESLA